MLSTSTKYRYRRYSEKTYLFRPSSLYVNFIFFLIERMTNDVGFVRFSRREIFSLLLLQKKSSF